MGQPYTDQDSYGFFEDDNATPDSCTQIGSTNATPAITLDYSYNLRFLLQNTGDKDETLGYTLWRVVDGGTVTQVTTTSTYVRIVASANWSDAASVGQVIGAGTYDEGYTDSNGAIAGFTFGLGTESENVWCVQFRSADIGGTETIDIYMRLDTPVDFDLYTNSPQVTSYATSVTVPVNTLTLASTHQTLTDVVQGPVSVVITEVTLASAHQTATIINVPPARLVTITEVTLASTHQTLTDVAVGPVDVIMTDLTLAGSVVTASVIPGPIIVDTINTFTLVSSHQTLTDVVPGPVAPAMTNLTLAGSLVTFTDVVGGPISVVFTDLTLASTCVTLTDVVPGAVTPIMNDLTLASLLQDIVVSGLEYPPVMFRFGQLHRARDPIHQLNI